VFFVKWETKLIKQNGHSDYATLEVCTYATRHYYVPVWAETKDTPNISMDYHSCLPTSKITVSDATAVSHAEEMQV
jgi:hypothetical protein